jgi:N-acyl-D-amino-acid deacylase
MSYFKTLLVLIVLFGVGQVVVSQINADEIREPLRKRDGRDHDMHDQLRKSERLRIAIDQACAVVEKSVKNYPENRQCFSCHHQALPLLSRSLRDQVNLREAPSDFWSEALTKSVLNFTEESFAAKRSLMREGKGVGGKALTVAYGLWTLDLAGAPRNETTDAMIDYLVKTQADDGAWNFQSVRPPAAASRSMTTAIAVYGLRAYGPDYLETNQLQEVFQEANAWSRQADESESQEDLNGLAWLDYMLQDVARVPPKPDVKVAEKKATSGETTSASSSDPFQQKKSGLRETDRLARRVNRILRNQNDDGGWGQTEDMPSDAYATGQTLLILAQVEYRDKFSIQSTQAFREGIEFLLNSQKPDGSWHVVSRSKPVQVFFDNGDPHGKDQFISMMATNWAVAALTIYQTFGLDPLESFQVSRRQSQQLQQNQPKQMNTENPFGS